MIFIENNKSNSSIGMSSLLISSHINPIIGLGEINVNTNYNQKPSILEENTYTLYNAEDFFKPLKVELEPLFKKQDNGEVVLKTQDDTLLKELKAEEEYPKNDFMSTIQNLFTSCLDIMGKKSADYSEDSNRYSNFEFAASVSTKYQAPDVMLNLMAIKLARLGQLLGNNKKPNNESTVDSIIDLINYACILYGYLNKLK